MISSRLRACIRFAGAALLVMMATAQAQVNLPSTNFSGESGLAPEELSLDRYAATPGFAHAPLADNPAHPGATPVGQAMCKGCHALEAEHFAHTVHARGMEVAAAADPSTPTCEACHGPGSAHAANPTEAGSIVAFTHDGGTPVAAQAAACLGCHEGGPRDHWTGSVHQRNDVSCSDCHNPHGSLTSPLLKTATVNETCWQCHAEKRGPFLFEHAPVRDSCLNCHTPHGSNQHALLVAPIPYLCQQCHSHVRHPNDLQMPGGLANGRFPDERLIARGCITCHAQIHGSNHPSGPRLHK